MQLPSNCATPCELQVTASEYWHEGPAVPGGQVVSPVMACADWASASSVAPFAPPPGSPPQAVPRASEHATASRAVHGSRDERGVHV
jgi:hypothetical protein